MTARIFFAAGNPLRRPLPSPAFSQRNRFFAVGNLTLFSRAGFPPPPPGFPKKERFPSFFSPPQVAARGLFSRGARALSSDVYPEVALQGRLPSGRPRHAKVSLPLSADGLSPLAVGHLWLRYCFFPASLNNSFNSEPISPSPPGRCSRSSSRRKLFLLVGRATFPLSPGSLPADSSEREGHFFALSPWRGKGVFFFFPPRQSGTLRSRFFLMLGPFRKMESLFFRRRPPLPFSKVYFQASE